MCVLGHSDLALGLGPARTGRLCNNVRWLVGRHRRPAPRHHTNLDGLVTLDDAGMFLDENATGSPAGDYNGDSAADSIDVDEFVTDFVGG